jgi:hypothetical protein
MGLFGEAWVLAQVGYVAFHRGFWNLFDSDGALVDLDMMEKIGKRRGRRRVISRTTAASYTTE